MSIKNKDGSVYRLRGPNPIMRSQDVWEGFEIHNMNFESQTENNNLPQIKKTNKINLGQVTIAPVEQPSESIKVDTPIYHEPVVNTPEQPDIVKVDVVPPPPPSNPFVKSQEEEHIIRPTKINEKLLQYRKTILHCLPAKVKTVIDDLYMDRSFKVSYGQKFTFEVIIVDETDLSIVFWTHLENVERFSIIYPQNNEKRWWKVDSVKSAPEGFFLRCLPSDDQPAFVLR